MRIKDESIRSVCFSGNRKAPAYYVTIPRRIVNELKLKPKQKVRVERFKGLIIIDPDVN